MQVLVRGVWLISIGSMGLALACGGDGSGDDIGGNDDDGTTGDPPGTAPDPTGTVPGDSTGMEPPPPGIDCTEPFVYQGLGGCLVTVEGIQIKFFPLPAGQPVEHLAVYFHGDTAPGWYDNWAFPTVVNWATPRNILTLGVLSPQLGKSGLPEFGEAQPVHAEMVATALETFADAWGAPREEIFYWSTSGGSWWSTSSYIPIAGGRLPGYFAISCGGSGFSNPFAWDNGLPANRDRISILLNYGSEDFLADLTDMSYEEYLAMGFMVDRIVYPGATHCDHPIDEPTLEFFSGFVP